MINLIIDKGVNEVAKFCRNCGKEINIETSFCPSCGTKIEDINPATNVETINIQSEKKDNTVAAFVLSLLGFLCCTYLAIPGLIMSIMSLQNMNNGTISTKNKALAIAGIVLGALGIIVMINNLVNPNTEVAEMVEEWFS